MRRGRRRNQAADDNDRASSGRLSYFLFGVVFGLLTSLSMVLLFSVDKTKMYFGYGDITHVANSHEQNISHVAKVEDKPVLDKPKNIKKQPQKKQVPISFVASPHKKNNKPKLAKPVTKNDIDYDYDFYRALSEGKDIKTSKPVVNSGDTISENSYFLRAASFKNENDATNLKTKLSRNGYSVSLQPVKINSEKWVRVLVGPFHTIKEAFIAKNALLRDGLKADMIKGNKN